MPWTTGAASAVGTSHTRRKQPCQDYTDVRHVTKGIIVGVCADGAGSAAKSDIGAGQAVETVFRSLSRLGYGLLRSRDAARETFLEVVAEVRENLEAAASLHAVSPRELACTLLCFVATPRRVAAMQVGDGLIVLHRPEGATELLFRPDRGEYANQTVFVTSSQVTKHMQCGLWTGPVDFIAAGSDGILTVAVRQADWSAHWPFFAPFHTYLRDEQPTQAEVTAELMDFLTSERLAARTDDDKTLLVCHYREPTGVGDEAPDDGRDGQG